MDGVGIRLRLTLIEFLLPEQLFAELCNCEQNMFVSAGIGMPNRHRVTRVSNETCVRKAMAGICIEMPI
jgi:hypothetical protein